MNSRPQATFAVLDRVSAEALAAGGRYCTTTSGDKNHAFYGHLARNNDKSLGVLTSGRPRPKREIIEANSDQHGFHRPPVASSNRAQYGNQIEIGD